MFEDEDGNEIHDLTEITYEVVNTWVDVTRQEPDTITFTHRIKVHPESLDLYMELMNKT